MRMLTRLASWALGIVVLYLAVTAVQIWSAAGHGGTAPADAIVVLGAAQYDGQPSPALRARLDHAATLFRRDVAPVVVVTGGRRPGDRFSEASASDLYLQRQGVPRDALRLEIDGADTYESLAATALFLRREGRRSVVLVSDPWHSYRLRGIAVEVGLEARVSPAAAPAVTAAGGRRLARETGAVAVGRLVGYRRLSRMDRLLP